MSMFGIMKGTFSRIKSNLTSLDATNDVGFRFTLLDLLLAT